MTQAAAGRRPAKAKAALADSSQPAAAAALTDEEAWRLGTAAAAALDQIDRPTAAEQEYDQHLALLADLEREARAGRMTKEELVARRSAVLDHLRESMRQVGPGPQLAGLSRLFGAGGSANWATGLYLPNCVVPAGAPAGPRYAVHWSSADPPGMAQVKTASTDTGALHVVNLALPARGAASGYAQAGIGILVRPRHAISRLTFRPEATFRFRYLIDTPRVRSYVPWSTAANRGQVRLVAQRVNQATGGFETYAEHAVPLWNDSVGVGSQLWQDSGAGSYPGADPGLRFTGTSGDLFALWFIASAYCAKNDQDPTAYTTCQANLDCEVPSMWVEETPLG